MPKNARILSTRAKICAALRPMPAELLGHCADSAPEPAERAAPMSKFRKILPPGCGKIGPKPDPAIFANGKGCVQRRRSEHYPKASTTCTLRAAQVCKRFGFRF
jgi:hypothetical protein